MPYSDTGFVTVGASKAGAAPSIYAYSTTDATAVATLAVVRSNASGVVDIDNGTTLANTDSD